MNRPSYVDNNSAEEHYQVPPTLSEEGIGSQEMYVNTGSYHAANPRTKVGQNISILNNIIL
jgi:hypothetical protein